MKRKVNYLPATQGTRLATAQVSRLRETPHQNCGQS